MRNSPFSSVTTQLYNSAGNNDVQMPNLGISMQVDSIVTNVQRNDFSMNSKLFKDDSQLRSDGGFAVSYQSLINYQQGFQSITTSYDNDSQQSFLLSQMRSLPQFDGDFESLQNASTQALGVNGLLPHDGINAKLAFNKKAVKVNKRINNKKKINAKSLCEEQWSCQVNDTLTQIQEHDRVPMKRSQKLSDKITALQKLVSPYGKTDTASVLQEASIYIKLLQEQIQKLFQMLSGLYNSAQALLSQGGEQTDLRSRGLCLVPISITQKVTQEDLVEPHKIYQEIP